VVEKKPGKTETQGACKERRETNSGLHSGQTGPRRDVDDGRRDAVRRLDHKEEQR
jgi:hypothetical protein